MRAYYFVNGLYMSQIQLGIQSLHCTTEMFVKYPNVEWTASGSPNQHLYDWAHNHKTVIILNAGYTETIRDLLKFFHTGTHTYPFAEFRESKEALDGALTSVGIVLPEKIYAGAAAMRKVKRARRDDPARMDFEYNRVLLIELEDGTRKDEAYTEFEVELMERLGTFRLA